MNPTDEQLDAALLHRFDSDAGDDLSFLEYFEELLCTLWSEEQGFSGKRPFGNSGWQGELVGVLSAAGFVDEDCYDDALRFVDTMIRRAFEVAGGRIFLDSQR